MTFHASPAPFCMVLKAFEIFGPAFVEKSINFCVNVGINSANPLIIPFKSSEKASARLIFASSAAESSLANAPCSVSVTVFAMFINAPSESSSDADSESHAVAVPSAFSETASSR